MWVKITVETALTYLKKNFLNFCHIISPRIWYLANVTIHILWFFDHQSLVVLFWGEVYQSPGLQKGVNSHYGTYIAKKVLSAKRWREVFFGIFPPHKNHRIPVVLVKVGIFDWKRENIILNLLPKVLRKVLSLDLMNGILSEPWWDCWKGYVRGRLYNGSRSQRTIVSNSLDMLCWHLDEIGWDNKKELRRYMLRMIFLVVKSWKASFGTTR